MIFKHNSLNLTKETPPQMFSWFPENFRAAYLASPNG